MKTYSISKKKAFKRVFTLVRPYWYLILASIICSSVASLISGAIAWLVKPLFDKIFLPQNYGYLVYLPFSIVGIFFLRGTAVFFQAYFMKKASYKLGQELRVSIYQKILKLPIKYSFQKATGDLISRIVNDILILENIIGDISRTFFLETLTVVILVGVALYRSWKLTFLTFLVFPLVVVSSEWLAQKTHKNRHRVQERIGLITQALSETFKGLKEIKVYLVERNMSSHFAKLCEEVYLFFLKSVKYEEGAKLAVNILTGMAGGIILLYGGYLIKRGFITPGDFFSLFTAILMVFNPVKKLAGTYNRFHSFIAALERIEEILAMPEEKDGQKKIQTITNGFEFYGVNFQYPGTAEFALKAINIKIPAGKTIAIIGKSGAGKSTLVSLLPRFYDPTEGSIFLDGVDLRDFDLTDLRKLFGIVSQEVVVFNMSVAENIALGKPGATREEIVRAAKLAYAHEFIDKLPQGYDTVLGKEGFSLSGGQKQRIAIARAILKNPPVLILDEATSHLDTVSERYVQMALEKLMKERTTLVIAHRLSTVRNADFVIVLENGKIVCKGTHADLEETCPQYKRLYKFLEQ